MKVLKILGLITLYVLNLIITLNRLTGIGLNKLYLILLSKVSPPPVAPSNTENHGNYVP